VCRTGQGYPENQIKEKESHNEVKIFEKHCLYGELQDMNIYIRLNTNHQPLRVIADCKQKKKKDLLRKNGKRHRSSSHTEKGPKYPYGILSFSF
jgi:hypothetical protein